MNSLPRYFCWTKFGTEAGETIESIFRRKEAERRVNGGLFLWGIGNSLAPAIARLRDVVDHPQVFFSPMRSKAQKHDALPDDIVVWTSAWTPDGKRFPLPDGTLVTSRLGARAHYALVCEARDPLDQPGHFSRIFYDDCRNLGSGKPVGFSQVTSVVEHNPEATRSSGPAYEVALMAYLTGPMFVTLDDPYVLPNDEELRSVLAAGEIYSYLRSRVRSSYMHTSGQMSLDL